MTSEVLIMRQNGIILASDKAITAPNDKSYLTSKKIYSLDDEFPSGMMINGYVDFEGIFIGDLIEEFKKECDFKKIGNIELIKNEFIRFLEKNTPYTSKEDYINWKVDVFIDEIGIEINNYGFDEVMAFHDQKEITEDLKSVHNFDHKFHNLIPNDLNKTEWNIEIWKIFSDWIDYEGTGAIITGYNSDSYYPTFFEINIHCNDNGKLVYEEVDSRVDWEDPFIKVFAIKKEAYSFLTGVNEDFEGNVKGFIEESHQQFINKLEKQLKKNNFTSEHIEKIISISKPLITNQCKSINNSIEKYKKDTLIYTSESIEYLSNMILCDLAEHLIKLTGLKQKISSELETVSIETDVSQITKSNNFKWIKRNSEKIKY